MTQVIADPVPSASGPPVTLGLPDLSDRVIARSRLERQLQAAEGSVVRIIEAPTGYGKTLGVARWASADHPVAGVLWLDAGRLDAGRGADDRELFWSRVRSGLVDLGAGPIAAVPAPSATGGTWARWIGDLAGVLEGDGDRRLLVLDDYPSGPSGSLGRQLTALLTQTTALRVVITCTGSPALDLARLRACGRLAHVGPEALRCDEGEVRQLLVPSGVRADPATIKALCRQTEGWAFGVDLAARALMETASAVEVLDELDDVLDDVIEAEVLDQLPAACREMVVRTSVCAEVPAGLSSAILGENVARPIAWIHEAQGFLSFAANGSWTCHPLLRRAALRRLDRDWPSLSRDARRAAARWSIDHGDRSSGLALAAELADWDWAATALVRSLAVPSVLLQAADPTTAEIASRVEHGAGEPLIVAAAAIADGEPEAAQAALSQVDQAPEEAGPDVLAHRLTEAILAMAIARARIEVEDGLHWVQEGRRRHAELTPRAWQSAPEISLLLATHEAAFAMATGDFARAMAVLPSAALVSMGSEAEAVAATECIGLLAWLEALRGNLTDAGRHAAEVLRIRPADGNEVGVGYAQLAVAWVHLERGELAEAAQRLDHTASVGTRTRDPWLLGAQRLASARVATRLGDPDVAVRLLTDLQRTHPAATARWLADRCTVALAEAHLAAGDARQVLAVLTPEPRQASVEARVLAARARHAIGDRRGARALVASVGDAMAEAPLPAVVQLWCLEAELASESGDGERALSLLTRALRAAHREELRSALSPVSPWLAAAVNRHPELSREHRAFLASMAVPRPCTAVAARREVPTETMLEPLTERELQVLERLAQFLTTDEIAADLYVSANTVKTHIKSLFLKLAVNRRSDAVRRGRRLGLC
jgi:LuxR family transcriptional regulator, maltose regulon positive regulatory protein